MRPRNVPENSEEPGNPDKKAAANAAVNGVLDTRIKEVIKLIGQCEVDARTSKAYQQQIADAFQHSAHRQKELAPFKALDEDENLSREELLEGLEKLLLENKFDSNITIKRANRQILQKILYFVLSVLLILTGFAMIIMPAPPSFEILTVYYFNTNDGVTVMDLFSLLIIFGGVLLIIFCKK